MTAGCFYCLLEDRQTFCFADQAGLAKMSGKFNNGVDVLAVISPRPIAGGELFNTASARVHDPAGGSVWALIEFIGNTVAIAIRRQLRTELYDPKIGSSVTRSRLVVAGN